MSEQRAILVSRPEVSHSLNLRGRFDAAGDQPRWPFCAEHGAPMLTTSPAWCLKARSDDVPCRVVDAIVCVVEP